MLKWIASNVARAALHRYTRTAGAGQGGGAKGIRATLPSVFTVHGINTVMLKLLRVNSVFERAGRGDIARTLPNGLLILCISDLDEGRHPAITQE
jgi:hypothetical protein